MLDSLRVLQLVAEHASFRRAAEEIGLTRPAVSHRIKQLEIRFDVQLVERTTRRVSLTPAGSLLLEHAAQVLHAADELEEAMQPLRREEQSRFTIGASTLPADKFLSPALVGLRQTLAEDSIQLYVRVGNTEQVLAWLEQREIDVAVVGCHVNDERFECRPFATDRLVLVGSPEADLPDPLPLSRLKTVPVILREPGSATREAVLEQLAAHGLSEAHLHVIAEMRSADAMWAAVQAGVGWAFFSTNYLQEGAYTIRQIEGVPLQRPLTLCRRRGAAISPPFQAVFERLPALLADSLK